MDSLQTRCGVCDAPGARTETDEEEVRAVACGALLHEIGKLEIPESILRKPAVLTAEERLIMRGYCLYGYPRGKHGGRTSQKNRYIVPHRPVEEKQKRIEFLEKKVQTKDEVLAELMAEHIALKKSLGEL